MIHPSYVELMKVVNDEATLIGEEPVVNSRYTIVCATAKRARQIIDGKETLIDKTEGMKPLSVAVEEMWEGQLRILSDDEAKEEAEKQARYRQILKEEEARKQAEAEAAAAEEAAKAAEEAEAAGEAGEASESEEA